MSDYNVHVDVAINDIKIVKKSYTLYRVDLKIIRGNKEVGQYHVFKRFSDFIKLKQNLEHEIHSELPYELPPRRYNIWGKPSGSCDPDIIEERKKELVTFLHDMLNDSFDTRWKNSPYLIEFLQFPSDWDKSSKLNAYDLPSGTTAGTGNSIVDAQKWLEELRNCKSQLEEARKDDYSTKLLIQLRLRIQILDKSLKEIKERQLVGEGEVQRRRNLLNALKDDLNKSSKGPSSDWNDTKGDEIGSKGPLFGASERSPQKPLVGRRKIGETEATIGLQNQELLQLDRSTMKNQDKQLEELRNIIRSQKNMSLEMNDELAAQNELLDMLSGDVETTATKLRTANRRAKKFNDG